MTPDRVVRISSRRLYQMDVETLSPSNLETLRKIDRVLRKFDQVEKHSITC